MFETVSTPICSKNGSLSWNLKMHILQITIFFKRGAAYTKGVTPKYGSLSWKYIPLCIQKIDVQLWRTYLTCLHVPCVLHLRKIYCEKGIACARGSIFDIEVDQGMPYFNGMLYRALPFYKRHAIVFQNVWTCAYRRAWAKNVIIKISSTHALAAYVFAFVQHSFWEITYPVAPAFCHNCLHCLLMEPQAQSK